jgi:cytoskeletal protein CcmA (bactofilin family)
MNLNNLTSSFMPEPTPGGPAKNVLASDVEIKGTIKFENELIIDGKVEGEILSDGSLVIGKNAEVRGEIKTKSVTVHGTVFGNITVGEKAELKASSQLTGDLKATRIIIEEGAAFIGKSEVTPNKSAAKHADSPRGVTPANPPAPQKQPVAA